MLAALETTYAVVPALWPFEIANVLAVAERRRRISPDEIAEFLEMLRHLPIQVERREAAWIWQATTKLARAYKLSAYDAAYLELAAREHLPLATLDAGLQNAALALGVATVAG